MQELRVMQAQVGKPTPATVSTDGTIARGAEADHSYCQGGPAGLIFSHVP